MSLRSLLSDSLAITPLSPAQIDGRREELSLNPMGCAPVEGIAFTAFLLTGPRTRCERMGDKFATIAEVLPASAFLGWLPGSEDDDAEAQRRWDDITEEYRNDRIYGREEDDENAQLQFETEMGQ